MRILYVHNIYTDEVFFVYPPTDDTYKNIYKTRNTKENETENADVAAFDKHEREIDTGMRDLRKYLFRQNEFSGGMSDIENKK